MVKILKGIYTSLILIHMQSNAQDKSQKYISISSNKINHNKYSSQLMTPVPSHDLLVGNNLQLNLKLEYSYLTSNKDIKGFAFEWYREVSKGMLLYNYLNGIKADSFNSNFHQFEVGFSNGKYILNSEKFDIQLLYSIILSYKSRTKQYVRHYSQTGTNIRSFEMTTLNPCVFSIYNPLIIKSFVQLYKKIFIGVEIQHGPIFNYSKGVFTYREKTINYPGYAGDYDKNIKNAEVYIKGNYYISLRYKF